VGADWVPFSREHRDLVRAAVAPYVTPDAVMGGQHLAATTGLFLFALWFGPRCVAWTSQQSGGAWLLGAIGVLLLVGLQTGAYVKAFLVHHDACHDSLFPTSSANALAALWCGAMSCTSPSFWTQEHDQHHAHSNNLDHPMYDQSAAWTVQRYLKAPRWQRLLYRLLTHRVVMLTLFPVAYFLVVMRLTSRWYENAVQFSLWALIYLSGAATWYLFTFVMGASFGVLVFHAQHTFHGVYKRRTDEWDYLHNALLGSTYLQLPRLPVIGPLIRFVFHGVEHHHLHHVHPGVPGYRLAAIQEAHPDLFAMTPQITLWEALGTTRFPLYNEETRELSVIP